jgi:hypothetical protein
MTNARGSKSARNQKAPTPTLVEVRCAQDGCQETTVMPFRRAAKGTHRCAAHGPKTLANGGTPEVTLDSGTVATLPNPADAPPPKPARKRKAEPTVAAKADVPEATPPAAHAPVAPTPKKGRGTKPGKPEPKPTTDVPAATLGSLRAIGDAWIAALKAQGHTKSTVSSYGADLELAYEHIGGDIAAGAITERQVTAFGTSALVTKKRSGKPKAQPTILKTRRALRLALVWAEQKGLIKKAPYSAA